MENQKWNQITANIEKDISPDDFELWIQPIKIVSFTEKEPILSVSDSFHRDTVLDRYKSKIVNSLKKLFKLELVIEILINNEKIESVAEPVKKRRDTKVSSKFIDTLDEKFIFKNFVTGPNNELAYAAAKRISITPGEQYNPFFIYGNTGLGKTHILQAIGHEALTKNHDLQVIYITSEHFLDEFVYSIQKKRMRAFRNKYRKADILLLDDVQFYEGKDQIQNELFHTFNLLIQSKKQMVFTSDRPPRELKGLEDRLISRFNRGLLADIKPPRYEVRKAILKQKMLLLKIKIDNNVIDFLAENITSNVRTLEGAINKIQILQDHKNRKVTLDEVKIQLEDILDIGSLKKVITSHEIQREIADYYNISVGDLKSKSRKKNIAKPRQMAMFLMCELTSLSRQQIGYEFGGRDHSTVTYARDTIEKEIKNDISSRNDYEQLYKRLTK